MNEIVSGSSHQLGYNTTLTSLKEKMFIIPGNVSSIQHLVRLLGTSRDTMETRNQLNRLISKTKDIIMSVNRDIHQLSQCENEGAYNKLQYDKLLKDFKGLVERFQKTQKISALRCKETIYEVKGVSPYEDEHSDDDSVGLLQSRQEMAPPQNESLYNKDLLKEREKDIKNIEDSIYEVNTIFSGLSLLVREQQFLIDNIEASTEDFAYYTRRTTSELETTQKRQRRKKRFLLFTFLILLLVFVLMVFGIWISR